MQGRSAMAGDVCSGIPFALGRKNMKPLTLVLGLASVSTLFFPGTARAAFEDCGKIHVEANATCQLEVEGGCEAHCTPVSFEAACAAEAQVTCQGQCNIDAKLDCTASC